MTWWPLVHRILSFLFFYSGWGVCLERASQGDPYTGPLVVGGMFLFHLCFTKKRVEEFFLVFTVALIFTGIDTIYSLTSLIHYQAGYPSIPHLAPLWVTSVWVLFAMCLNHSLSWLYQRWFLASLLGASTAILSYLAAEKMGSLVFLQPPIVVEIVLGVIWAAAFPLSLIYSRWVTRQFDKCCFCKQ